MYVSIYLSMHLSMSISTNLRVNPIYLYIALSLSIYVYIDRSIYIYRVNPKYSLLTLPHVGRDTAGVHGLARAQHGRGDRLLQHGALDGRLRAGKAPCGASHLRCWSDAGATTRLEGGDRYGELLSLIQ